MDPNLEEDESNTASAAVTKKMPNYQGPKQGVKYPLTVIYCGGN